MSTIPPSAAEMDAWFQQNVVEPGLNQEENGIPPWTNDEYMVPFNGITAPVVYVAWTDNTAQQHFLQLDFDPRHEYLGGIESGVPFLQGLIDAYGAITLRSYSLTYQTANDIVASDDATQTSLNDSSNWATAE